jgi:hypothetical protein
MPFPPENSPLAYSHLAGREVSTWSEEWKHECEIAYLAAIPIGKRNLFLDGSSNPQDRDDRGVKGVRGEAAVAALRAAIERYEDLRRGH